MKHLLLPLALMGVALAADDPELAEKIERHQTGSKDLSERQDELAADVQQLTIEQTHPKVIELFRQVEDAMDEASELLWERETGGVTIAAETDVIEKIYEAAKERQKQQGGGSCSGGAMLEMMERMMGKGEKPGQGEKPGDTGGEGMTGESDAANSGVAGAVSGQTEERRVPKGAGTAGKALPGEFRDALKAYNRGAEKLVR